MPHHAPLRTVLLACLLFLPAGCSPAEDPPDPAPGAEAPAPIALERPADVRARASEILSGDDPLRRLIELGNLLETLRPDDVPVMVEAFEYAPLDGGDPELVMMGLWWAQHDPEAAYLWTSSDWRAQYGSVIGAVFRVWGRSDPERAFQLARGVRYPGQRDIATDATIAGWAESGAPNLMKFLTSLSRTDQQRLGEIVARRRVVDLGPEEAIRWVETIKQDRLRGIMALRVVGHAAAVPHGVGFATNWAEPLIEKAERPTGYPRRIGTRWIRHDPVAAMSWLATLPAGDDRDDGVTESYRDWHRRDPEAAREWIDSIEMERWNEPAFLIYARMRAREHPEEAIELAARMTDDALQRRTYVNVGRIWTTHHPEDAKTWFASSGLPEDLVRRATTAPTAPRKERLRRELEEAAAEAAAEDAAAEALR